MPRDGAAASLEVMTLVVGQDEWQMMKDRSESRVENEQQME